MKQNSILNLSSTQPTDTVRILGGVIDSNVIVQAGETSTVHLCRTGKFNDPRYDDFELTLDMFNSVIRNFDARVFGQDIHGDVSHQPSLGSIGTFKRLFLNGNDLYAEIQWTQLGADKVNNEGYRYFSIEMHPNYVSNEFDSNNQRREYGPTLLGAAITTRPVIKKLTPIGQVQLSEQTDSNPLLLSENIQQQLSQEINNMWKRYEAQLKLKLAQLGLEVEQVNLILEQAKSMFELATDEDEGKATYNSIVALAEGFKTNSPTSTEEQTQQTQPTQLSQESIKDWFEQWSLEQESAQRQQDLQLSALKAVYDNLINQEQGLSDDIKTQLLANANLINSSMTEENVRKLAENQIAYGHQMSANSQLEARGFLTTVNGQLTLADNNGSYNSDIIRLSETQIEHMRNTSAYANNELHLTSEDDLPAFVKLVLAEFDRTHQNELQQEALLFAGNTTTTSTGSIYLPRGYQRHVIRESLCELTVLELVKTSVKPNAETTTDILFEKRNISAAIAQGYTFENQSMPRSSVSTDNDTAWVLAIKIIFDCSNEVLHFSAASDIDWEAWAANVASAARALREIIASKISNEMQRVSDAHSFVAITDEDITERVNTGAVFAVNEFPIINQFQQFNIRGETVGAVENPITVTIDGNSIPRFDGSGEQPAGNYWVISNYNVGYVLIVNEGGHPVNPNAVSATISYSASTNVIKFDIDVPEGVEKNRHFNGLLQAFGDGKALLADDRFIVPNFALMSHTANNQLTSAEQFTASGARNDSKMNSSGELETVKGINCYATNTPGTHLGDQRLLIGVKGTLQYVVVKPFTQSEVQERRNSAGQLNAGKEAYGEEYSAIKCPKPLRGNFISIIFYSVTDRNKYL